ncbi:MAG: hypothetical protein Q8M40_10490 [Legionella sp.]|nr:hypothetical protein [Legionella sp.]
MNPSFKALTILLDWQYNDLIGKLYTVQQESLTLQQQILKIETKLNQRTPINSIINPEFEISKFNFFTQQQAQKAELTLLLNEQKKLETTLSDQILQTKRELKLLAKHTEREQLNHKQHQRVTQEKALDEWVIQMRKQ